MKIETHIINNTRIAEVTSDNIIIESIEDGVQLLAYVCAQSGRRFE